MIYLFYLDHLNTGQSHLINPIKDAQKIPIVPASFETLGMDTNTGRTFLTEQIQTDMAQHCEILVGMTLTDPRFIFPKCNIKHPMQAVLGSGLLENDSPFQIGALEKKTQTSFMHKR